MVHPEAVLSGRRISIHLESGQVVVFESLRESRSAVGRQSASVHRDRVAHDGGGPTTNPRIGAFSIGMVATSVLGECCLAAEGFTTAGDETLVGTSASVNSAVTSERAGIRECLAARLADVRTFSSVDANVDGQGGALDECLAALAKMTCERAFLAVNACVSVESQRVQGKDKGRAVSILSSQ